MSPATAEKQSVPATEIVTLAKNAEGISVLVEQLLTCYQKRKSADMTGDEKRIVLFLSNIIIESRKIAQKYGNAGNLTNNPYQLKHFPKLTAAISSAIAVVVKENKKNADVKGAMESLDATLGLLWQNLQRFQKGSWE